MTAKNENSGFGHVEFRSSDLAKTVAFYGKVFGYKFDDMGQGYLYSALAKGPTLGASATDTQNPPGTLSYVTVKNLDASLRACEAAGAKVILPKTEIPNFGHFAVILAPGDVTQGLWQMP